jgi:hypothetical protein
MGERGQLKERNSNAERNSTAMSEMSQRESDSRRVNEATGRWTGASRYKSDRLTCLEVLGMQPSMGYCAMKP